MKLGFVQEGGGMKCAYTAGILDRVLDDQIKPDCVVGVSAGASCGASFVAGQRDRNRRFFVDHITDPDYIGWTAFRHSKGNFFNLKYIYQDLTGKYGKDPLDYDAIMENPCDLFVGATDAKTGRIHYFTKYDMQPTDYSIFMASCAIPVVCRPVKVGKNMYFDGGCSSPIPVRRALEEGCDKVVVTLCRPKDTIREPQKYRKLYHTALFRYPKIVKALDVQHERYNRSLQAVLKLEQQGRAFVIAPKTAGISTYTKDPQVLQHLYDTAIQDYDEIRDDLLKFCECK